LSLVRLVAKRRNPREYVLVEAFRDGDAGAAHVQSDHFRAAQRELPPHLAATPRIVNFVIPQDDWSELGELAVDAD
jgi:quinol monooxygenase YgiN